MNNALQAEMNDAQGLAELKQLEVDDPGEYAKRMLKYQHRHQMINAARQEQTRLETQQQAARVPQERRALAGVNKAFEQNFDNAYRQVGEWALDPAGGGLSQEIWNGVYDHRFVNIAHKAMLYDRMQSEAVSEAAPRVREQTRRTATVLRPGVSRPAKSVGSKATEEYTRALHDKKGMTTTEGIAKAILLRERAKKTRVRGN